MGEHKKVPGDAVRIVGEQFECRRSSGLPPSGYSAFSLSARR